MVVFWTRVTLPRRVLVVLYVMIWGPTGMPFLAIGERLGDEIEIGFTVHYKSGGRRALRP